MNKLILRKKTVIIYYSLFVWLSRKFLRGGAFLLLLCYTTAAYTQSVKELTTQIAELKGGDLQVDIDEGSRLEQLVYELNPAVYIKAKTIKAFGKRKPLCAYVDANAIDKLYSDNPLFDQVELISIKVPRKEDLIHLVDLGKLAGFGNLKYIVVTCGEACSSEQVERMFTGVMGHLIICYRISIPS